MSVSCGSSGIARLSRARSSSGRNRRGCSVRSVERSTSSARANDIGIIRISSRRTTTTMARETSIPFSRRAHATSLFSRHRKRGVGAAAKQYTRYRLLDSDGKWFAARIFDAAAQTVCSASRKCARFEFGTPISAAASASRPSTAANTSSTCAASRA
jgi:hypothetical protein